MNWIKSHKLIVLLIAIIVFLLFRGGFSPLTASRSMVYEAPSIDSSFQASKAETTPMQLGSIGNGSSASTSNVNRMVVQTSNMSLLVKDVKESGEKILSFAKENGGYMINASYSRPAESPFGTISIRIPANKLDKALEYFRGLAIKVTNENLRGTDITEEYTDIQARLDTLNKTKAKFETILDQATRVQDILTVQREIISLQSQIDSLIGQQKAMEKNAELTKITIYLSTDELALPYAPDNVFRPDVVFKYAVRSLLTTLTKIATAAIWIAVYSPLVAVCVLIYIGYKRWRKRRSSTSN